MSEPLTLPPDGPCIDSDGHEMVNLETAASWLPVATVCTRCWARGRVRRDTTPQDAP